MGEARGGGERKGGQQGKNIEINGNNNKNKRM